MEYSPFAMANQLSINAIGRCADDQWTELGNAFTYCVRICGSPLYLTAIKSRLSAIGADGSIAACNFSKGLERGRRKAAMLIGVIGRGREIAHVLGNDTRFTHRTNELKTTRLLSCLRSRLGGNIHSVAMPYELTLSGVRSSSHMHSYMISRCTKPRVSSGVPVLITPTASSLLSLIRGSNRHGTFFSF